VNFGQNFGPCSSKQSGCKIKRANKGIERKLKRIRKNNKKNQNVMLVNFLMRIKF